MFVDNAALIGPGRLDNNTVLRDRDGNAIGRTLAIVEIDKTGAIVPGQRTVSVRIVASTHKNNIRTLIGKVLSKVAQAPDERTAQESKEETLNAVLPRLTDEEERMIEEIGTGPGSSRTVFRSEDVAIKYLRVLLKRDHRTIHFTKQYDSMRDEDKIRLYGRVIRGTLAAITTKAMSEGVPLAIVVAKTRKEYPLALAGAAAMLKAAGDNSVVPYLHELTEHPETIVRLNAGKSLLAMGEIDAALPVLDRLSKEGTTAALGEVYWGMQGKAWNKKGLELIRRALTYENKETRALAGLFLARLASQGKATVNLENVIETEMRLFREILSQKQFVEIKSKTAIGKHIVYSDRAALESVITALVELKYKDATAMLKQLMARPDIGYLKRSVDNAIRELDMSRVRE